MDEERLINDEEGETDVVTSSIYPQVHDQDKREYEHHLNREHDPSIQQFPARQSSERSVTLPAAVPVPIIATDDYALETQIIFPEHHAGIAWLSVFFCCFPLSICAVYSSEKTIKSIRKGDVINARRYSFLARKLASLAIIFGVFMLALAATLYYLYRFNVMKNV